MPATNVTKVKRILCSVLDVRVSASSSVGTMSASYKGEPKKGKTLLLLDAPAAVLAVCPPGTPLAKRETCAELATPLETVKPVRRTLSSLYSACIQTSCYPLINQCCRTSCCACFHKQSFSPIGYTSFKWGWRWE